MEDKERQEALKRLMAIPIGANKRFLVRVSGQDCAGFDTKEEANSYIAMMRKGGDRPKASACAKMDWTVVDRG